MVKKHDYNLTPMRSCAEQGHCFCYAHPMFCCFCGDTTATVVITKGRTVVEVANPWDNCPTPEKGYALD